MLNTSVMTKTIRLNTNIICQEEKVSNSMTVAETAKIMGKTPSFIRIGLQRGTLPFGTAQIMPGSRRYTYYISPVLFFQYIGRPLPEKYKEKEELQGEERYRVVTDPAEMTEIFKVWRCN